MGTQLFQNPNVTPTPENIAQVLGKTNDVYLKFLEDLKGYDVELTDWRFYEDRKNWFSKGDYHWITSRGTEKEKPLFWLSIWNGYFEVSFSFGLNTKDKLLALPISDEAKKIINNADVKGKTMKFISIFFDIDNEKQFNDIFVIMTFREDNI